ncbi:hypothetical protein SGCOL_011652, partial [Colletotrichum sp. CLE4]
MALYTMALTALLLRPALGYTLNLLPSFSNYTVPVEPISLPDSLDGAKANFSVNAPHFRLLEPQPLVVQVTGSFSNGTGFHKTVEATDRATITNDENGRAPAHYLCALNEPDVSEELLPYVCWANAVPGAAADVDITIDGERISFVNGVGYNDKKWADKSIIKSHKFRGWVHAQFGPYFVVWFVVTEKDNSTCSYAYVAKDGEPIRVACSAGSVNVQQWGGLAANLPTIGLNDVDGLIVTFSLGDGQTLVANVTKTTIVLDEVVHQRANGVVSGQVLDSELTYDGFAHFEDYIIGFIDVKVR